MYVTHSRLSLLLSFSFLRVVMVINAGLSEQRAETGDVPAMRGAVLCLQATPGFLKSVGFGAVGGGVGGGYVGGELHKALMGAAPALARIMLGADCDREGNR
jgi:hypothetical protein